MTVKVQLEECRDRRHKKRAVVSDITKTILFNGEADSSLVKIMDGAKYAYFIASVEYVPDAKDKKGLYNPKDSTRIQLGTRLNNQGW